MVEHLKGAHHHNVRKRIYKKHEPYPSPDKIKRFIDKIIYPVAFLGPIMTLPQVIQIWFGKDASGVSAISWSSYIILSMVWITYGIFHKEKPIIYSSLLWIVLQLSIAIGAVIY